MLATFNWKDMPEDTHYGDDPDAIILLQRGMKASEFDEGDDFPIKSRAFRSGKTHLIDEVVRRTDAGDGFGLLELTSGQTIEGHAQFKNLTTPFISLAPWGGHAIYHAEKHDDGILVDVELPASSLIVPWMMENSPGRLPYEVHAVGAIPAGNIVKVTHI